MNRLPNCKINPADTGLDVTDTGRVVDYVCSIISRYGAGQRILELGCRDGQHAVALARKGYRTTGIDACTASVARAKVAAAAAHVNVDFVAIDLLMLGAKLPVDVIDAAICMRSPEWGSDSDFVRLLRAVRDKIADDGVLILDHANPMSIARGIPAADATVPGGRYDLVADRDCGPQAASVGGHKSATAQQRMSLRTVPELAHLLRVSGFEVVCVDSDFVVDATPSLDAAHVQIVARPTPTVPVSLSLSVHQLQTAEPVSVLNLKWSPDEIEWLDPPPDQIWSALLAGGAGDIARTSRNYALTDPWGGERAAAVLSTFFETELRSDSIVFGPGATGLLRQIALLASAGRVLTTRLVHRDFPLWAAAEGARLDWLADGSDDDDITDALAKIAPDIVYFDRPSATGAVMSLERVVRICREAHRCRAFVAIDEAYLAYFGGADSAVSLVPSTDNLIVIRSLSKAYCCGGLRIGFAVGGAIAATELRRVVSPLQVSELAYQMGLRLLEAGDIFGKLRRRIVEAKSAMMETLASDGFSALTGHEHLPWILLADKSGRVQSALAARGVTGKRLVPFGLGPVTDMSWLRLSVPLSADRMAEFRRAMAKKSSGTPVFL
jgi:histidinol-phosphate/aromatic aminotransferase/cobyric acid decarboxylase-like protein/SAM-dependent methyltransferase